MPDESIDALLYKSISNYSCSSMLPAATTRLRMMRIARAIHFLFDTPAVRRKMIYESLF